MIGMSRVTLYFTWGWIFGGPSFPLFSNGTLYVFPQLTAPFSSFVGYLSIPSLLLDNSSLTWN